MSTDVRRYLSSTIPNLRNSQCQSGLNKSFMIFPIYSLTRFLHFYIYLLDKGVHYCACACACACVRACVRQYQSRSYLRNLVSSSETLSTSWVGFDKLCINFMQIRKGLKGTAPVSEAQFPVVLRAEQWVSFECITTLDHRLLRRLLT